MLLILLMLLYGHVKAVDIKSVLSKLDSGFQCAEAAHKDYAVCIFSNLVLQNKKLYQIQDVGGKVAHEFEGGWDRHKDKAIKFHIHGETVDKLSEGVERDKLQTAHVKEALFWVFEPSSTLYDIIAEHALPIHSILCKHLQRCEYDANQDKSAFWIFKLPRDMALPAADPPQPIFNDLYKCFTPDPVLFMDDPILENKFILMTKSIFLVRHKWSIRKPTNPQIMASFRKRMAACRRWGSDVKLQLKPLDVVLMDQPVDSRLHIYNLPLVQEKLRQKFNADAVQIQLVENSRKPNISDIDALRNAAVVVAVKGGSMASALLMPEGGAFVHIEPNAKAAKLHEKAEAFLKAMSTGVHLIPLTNNNISALLLDPELLHEDRLYDGMSLQQKLALWTDTKCPASPSNLNHHCHNVWLGKQVNFEVGIKDIGQALMKAFKYVCRAGSCHHSLQELIDRDNNRT